MSYARKRVTRRKAEPVNERKLRNAARHAEIWQAFKRGEITGTINTPEGVRIIRTEAEIREIYNLPPKPAPLLKEDSPGSNLCRNAQDPGRRPYHNRSVFRPAVGGSRG